MLNLGIVWPFLYACHNSAVKRFGLVLVLVAALCACSPNERASLTGSSGTSSIQDRENGVRIDADVFAYREDVGTSNETFVLTGATDQASAVAAVARAGTRFMQVDKTGKE